MRKFNEYIVKFGRTYQNDPIEYETRFNYFQDSIKRITKLQKISPYARFELNKFSDQSPEEFSRMLSKSMPASVLARNCLANGVTQPQLDVEGLPTTW
jgi:hypothetical protein